MFRYDYLVIGSGGAGLTFALEASTDGTVALVTKKESTDSNTILAQGGIAGVLGPDDAHALHVDDTLIAGAGLCDPVAVNTLVNEGPDAIRALIALGASFSLDSEGALSLGREGGHSRRRIVRHADKTGSEVENTLIEQVRRRPNIHILEHHTAIDLIAVTTGRSSQPACAGAYVLDEYTRRISSFVADVTVLATGGCGQVYQHTTNPSIASGDGIAIGWRAGCQIANMEFIQFHPTSLYAPGSHGFLISEGVRGEGGILRRANGEAFMLEYDNRADLAPRDIVARAIDTEMKKANDACVYLDITHKEPDWLKSHFPTIYAKCLNLGIDITTSSIPVVPAAHYSCGGLQTNHDARTNIQRLYACGEVACTGVHGANRLASNSLLEALVFARRAAADARSTRRGWDALPAAAEFDASPLVCSGEVKSRSELKARLRAAMQRYVGIVRTNARLQKASDLLEAISDEAAGLFSDGVVSSHRLELRNLIEVARLIVVSAQQRKESRGLHFTTDYPISVNSERHDTVLARI